MFHIIMAILMGLASPAHSKRDSKCHNGTTMSTYGDDKPVGGDGGHIPPAP